MLQVYGWYATGLFVLVLSGFTAIVYHIKTSQKQENKNTAVKK